MMIVMPIFLLWLKSANSKVQGRFPSSVLDQNHLLAAVRYVELNQKKQLKHRGHRDKIYTLKA
jgi:hypothetical protein